MEPNAAPMAVVMIGHVDHGKSTILGRMLADSGSLPEGKLERIRRTCERQAKPFEFAFLLDALKDEQAQGITIDAARVFFHSAHRRYTMHDAPGHIEFLKNMVTGAARAEAAILVIDAKEGIQANSRRHGYLLSVLGIRQLIVVVNKLDLVDYQEAAFQGIVDEYQAFLHRFGVKPVQWIPVSGVHGDNIVRLSDRMDWYRGPTLLEALDALTPETLPLDGPFRMPVQDVYRFTEHGDDRRIIAGTIESGTLRVGDEVAFFPSGKRSRVKSLESFPTGCQDAAYAGQAIGYTLEEQLYVRRGELAIHAKALKPVVSTRLKTSVFWLGKTPLVSGESYMLKLGTIQVPAQLEQVLSVMDSSTLEGGTTAQQVGCNEVAQVILRLKQPISCDFPDACAATSRFALIHRYAICGGGTLVEALPDHQASQRELTQRRNSKWEHSLVSVEQRAERYGQRPTVVILTGPQGDEKKEIAKALELSLFQSGRSVYYMGMRNLLYGMDADLATKTEDRSEHVRRLAEVANLFLDAGMILIVTASELDEADVEVLQTAVAPWPVTLAWVGAERTTNAPCDVHLVDPAIDQAIETLSRFVS